ncbi:MAG TPA: CBS domain-containing protein [Dokdonella sp.]|uniref:CBS domain-containing protein n=1 Tax=Dokdonella sp. TaxID=2291710 RepID=UPI002D7F85C0|nr:CBS domain-containing protein [Dokdonella sp.]HET9031538.1 CBS domain-containing protein [Dokdonella sp.]
MLQVKHLLDDKGHEILAITPDAPVLDAIKTMAERRIGALLVLKGDELVGIVSERDYARNVVLKGRSSSSTQVFEIMGTEMITVGPDDTVDHCMRLCTNERVRYLPVVDGGKTIGVLSLGDLVKAVISQQTEQIEQLQRYIAG